LSDVEKFSFSEEQKVEVDRQTEAFRRERDISAELEAIVEKLGKLGRVIIERRERRPWGGI